MAAVLLKNVTERWNANGNCMLVVGAQHTHAMKAIREFAPQIPLLVPGVGAQGGEAAAVVRAGLSPDGSGLIINSSRGILFSGDPERAAAKELRDETSRGDGRLRLLSDSNEGGRLRDGRDGW